MSKLKSNKRDEGGWQGNHNSIARLKCEKFMFESRI